MSRISVYLADKQILFREGIHFILSGEVNIDVVGETTSNEEALAFIEAHLFSRLFVRLNGHFC